jgi:hypothetical protein
MKGTLHEDQHTFYVTACLFLLRMGMFQTKVVEKIKTHFGFGNFFFLENSAFG